MRMNHQVFTALIGNLIKTLATDHTIDSESEKRTDAALLFTLPLVSTSHNVQRIQINWLHVFTAAEPVLAQLLTTGFLA